MTCYCCARKLTFARKVKLRPWRDFDPRSSGLNPAASIAYREEMTYRWSVICQACYSVLDNATGIGVVAGKEFQLAGCSRRDRARNRKFIVQEAAKIGYDLEVGADWP